MKFREMPGSLAALHVFELALALSALGLLLTSHFRVGGIAALLWAALLPSLISRTRAAEVDE